MKTCIRCFSELVTIETGNTEIETCFCKECGLIESSFYPKAREALLKIAVRVGEEKEEKKD